MCLSLAHSHCASLSCFSSLSLPPFVFVLSFSVSLALLPCLSVCTVDQMGRVILAGGAAVGLGALCYYGLGMSNEIGALEKAV